MTIFSQISWLIVALPVASFLLIGLAMIVSGKGQRLARAVAPWLIIAALVAALVIAAGALHETLQGQARARGEQEIDTANFSRDVAPAGPVITYEKSIDWLTPEPATKQDVDAIISSERVVNRTLKVGVLIDPLAAVMLVVVALVSLLVQIYSYGYMKKEEHPRFFLYMSLFTASMLGLVISSSLVQLFIFWELVGLCSYLLIGFWYQKPEAVRAAVKAFVVTRFGDLGLLFAVIFLWLGYGDLSFSNLPQLIQQYPNVMPVSLAAVAVLIFFGAMGKSAQFPLHIWLPDAMEGPTSVSALIHAATMVAAGIYLVARTFFIFEAGPSSLLLVALVGGFTALFAASVALAQVDMKKVLAYSTISQLGYMVMGLGFAAPAAAMFHLTTHAFFKALLFLTAGSVIHAVHTQSIWEMGGLYNKMKVTAITCLIGGLALAGVFPFAGFFSKDQVLESALAAALGQNAVAASVISPAVAWCILIMALLTVLLTAFYTTRMWALVFLGKPRSREAEHAQEAPRSMRLPLVVLAALTCIAGAIAVIPDWANLIAPDRGSLLPPQAWMMTILSLGLALTGIYWGYVVYGKQTPAKEPLRKLGPLYTGMMNLWYVDAAFTWFARQVVLGLAQVARKFDKRVVDGGLVDGTAWSTGRLGHLLRRVSAGPQPGQLQYYALVIFVITVLVVLGFSGHHIENLVRSIMGR